MMRSDRDAVACERGEYRLRGSLRALLVACVLLLTVISYLNSVDGEFQFDDDPFISENPSIGNLHAFFSADLFRRIFSQERVLTNLTFSLNYAMSGFSVQGYHYGNIFFHLLAVFSVYLLLRLIFTSRALQDTFKSRSEWMALIGAAVFGVHPLQTQSVAYIVQRAETLASLCYVTSIFFLVRYLEARGARAFAYWLLGLVCFALGFGFKQIIVSVPLVFIIYIIYLGGKNRLGRGVVAMIPVFVAGVLIAVKIILAAQGNPDVGFDIPGLSSKEYLLTQLRVLITYVRLSFLPVHQNLDYDYPVLTSIWDLRVLGSLTLWIIVISLSIYALKVRGPWRGHFRLMGFGVLWFLVVLSPTSSFLPLKDVINEHRMYLPLLGIIMSVLAAADMSLRVLLSRVPSLKMRFVLIPVVLCTVAALAYGTHERNRVWHTKLSLWTDVTRKSPGKSRGFNNLGNCHYLLHNDAAALSAYARAIDLDPGNAEPYFNSAVILERNGYTAEAGYYYLKFIEIAPESYAPLVRTLSEQWGLYKAEPQLSPSP